ncbi:hypothetical protein AB0J81_34140 [Streptomyces bobili]|uniref:hypothetical protein n=1 Tax=Streptomyces bobili TaxID=67280 RepID=UPI00342261EB
MSSRPQNSRRGAWRGARIALLRSALGVLLTTLMMCLGSVAHVGTDRAADAVPVSAPAAAEAGTDQRVGHRAAAVVARSDDCPPRDECCGQADPGVRAVLPASVAPLPAVLPRLPGSRCGSDTGVRALVLPPSGGPPDLHVLQVQRS